LHLDRIRHWQEAGEVCLPCNPHDPIVSTAAGGDTRVEHRTARVLHGAAS
jgi:hypothetical protein